MTNQKQCWLQISSGRGPVECCLAVGLLAKELTKEARELGICMELIQMTPGPTSGTFNSMLFAIEGGDISAVQEWCGTILWINPSPFRPHHKRKNWYIGVSLLTPPGSPSWSEKEIKVETMRASGPGGQHVNKVESAVRITHLASGISVTAREERSQYLNRKLAMARLAKLFEDTKKRFAGDMDKSCWQKHNRLERGNPVRTYSGANFDFVG